MPARLDLAVLHARCPQDSWSVGPSRPQLGGGALHIWFADLAEVPAGLLGALSGPERERAAAILGRSRAQRWASARAVCRELLGRYTGRDPSSLEFVPGANGKPELAGSGASADTYCLHFNIAHSGRLALYALARDQPVGVDLEDGSKASDNSALARRLLGADDGECPSRTSDTNHPAEFLSQWVRVESGLKCLGGSLADAPRAERDLGRLWHTGLSDLPDAPRAVGAVAAPTPPRELRLWAYG